MPTKYIKVALRSGESRIYKWSDVDWNLDGTMIAVRDHINTELLLCFPVTELLYMEQMEKEEEV